MTLHFNLLNTEFNLYHPEYVSIATRSRDIIALQSGGRLLGRAPSSVCPLAAGSAATQSSGLSSLAMAMLDRAAETAPR